MSQQNYVLGRGKLYFAPFIAGTMNPQGEAYIGNSPDLGFSASQETLDHFGADNKVSYMDESVVLRSDYTGSFSTDHISGDNLALFFFGEEASLVQATGTVSNEQHNAVKQDRFYQLGASSTNPSGVRGVSAVVVKDDATPTPTTFTITTDYTVDLELGRVYVVPGGAIANGTNLRIDYTRADNTRSRVVAKGETIEGALRYVSDNPAGEQRDYYMPYVKLMANGDFTLKGGDAWQSLPFQIKVLRKEASALIYMDGRPI